jgi:hypothetical protein
MWRCMPALNTICSTDAKQSVSAPALYVLGQRLHHVDSAVDSVRSALTDAHCHAKRRPQLAASALPTPVRCPHRRAKVRHGPGLPTRQAQGSHPTRRAGYLLRHGRRCTGLQPVRAAPDRWGGCYRPRLPVHLLRCRCHRVKLKN